MWLLSQSSYSPLSVLLPALGLLKATCASEFNQKWAILNAFDVSLMQSTIFKKLHMDVLVIWDAFMTSSIIWSVLQNAVKRNLKEFQRWLWRTQ